MAQRTVRLRLPCVGCSAMAGQVSRQPCAGVHHSAAAIILLTCAGVHACVLGTLTDLLLGSVLGFPAQGLGSQSIGQVQAPSLTRCNLAGLLVQ